MNALTRLESGILGGQGDIERLKKADSARILVLSDSHGHYQVVESIIREYGPECDALLFAGDGMWDIVQYLENAQESQKLRDALPAVAAFVAGNGDGEQYRMSLPVAGDAPEPGEAPGFSFTVPSRQIIQAAGYQILLVHGHHHSVDVSLEVLLNSAHAMNCDIAVFGHTHIPFAEEFSSILALNPGSLSRPRGRSSASFAVLSLEADSTVPAVQFHPAR